MATDYCKYHPLSTARWHCPGCCIRVCDDCAPAGTDMETLPNCILCNQPLQPVRTGMTVQSYWERYTDFLRQPFAPAGLAMLLLVTVAPVLAPEPVLPVLGVAGTFLMALAGWGILQQATKGELDFPAPAALASSLSSVAFQGALLLALLVGAMVFAGARFPLVTLLGALAMAFAIPGALMAIASEKSVGAAFRADAWRNVLGGLRFLYFPVGVTALGLLLLTQALISLLADVSGPGVVRGLRNGLQGYALWVVFSLSGYCLLQFQDALGFQGEGARSRTRRNAVRRLDSHTARLEVFLKEGLYDKALALLKSQAEKQRNDPAIQERYFQLLVYLKDKEGVAMQGESYMAALLAAGRADDALSVFAKILLVMPEFRPEEAAVTFDLAKACVERREFGRAAALLDGLHQTAPHFPQLPEAYMLRAKLLHEKLAQSPQALEVMEYLVARFQKHPRFELMKAYWQQLGGRPPSHQDLGF